MRIELLRKSLPVQDGCCGVEFQEESEEFEKAVMQVLEEKTGRRWINTLSVFEDLHGNMLIVHNFPRNLRRAERLGLEQFPALIIGREIAIQGNATRSEIEKALEKHLNNKNSM
ncbi:hypothetical protein [Candidatus Pyrohabitans sp.]